MNGAAGKNRIVVAAGLIFRGGLLLISQRPPGRHGALQWEFPGGKVHEGESVESALARELEEELGVRVRVHERMELIQHDYPGKSVEIHFHRCSLLEGEPRPLDVHAIAWTGREELNSYDFLEADRAFIAALVRMTWPA
ncbi:MAG: putative 8-oxo-dGTP diphosphatase 2 [Myxococcota bacterium]|nr:putative 8-oxo-dGTP diphosphatase 2 [Myxococcota bacterium]